MKNNPHYLIFLPCCLLVKGYERSVILDIQRNILDFIPNDLYKIFQKHNKQELSSILSQYEAEDQEIIQEYIDFLIKNEYAILGSEHDARHIVDLPVNYNYCGQITNCVCEYSDFIKENIGLILDKIDKQLGCSAFQLLLSKSISVEELTGFLKNFEDSTYITHLEIVLPYSSEYTDKTIYKLLIKQCLINKITFYNSPFEKLEDLLHAVIIHTKQDFNRLHCGIVAKEYFTQNMFHITEAIHHNTCLHKKISIDKAGNIKNCLFSNNCFCNVLDNNILDIIHSRSFQKLGLITKDQIKVCKDCEFRYVCTDCRIYIKDTNDIYSQPEKCTYNPYIAKWQDEADYISVEESLKELSVPQ
jgi:SPASM domain peptide maturase of grasp-with-spasm system